MLVAKQGDHAEIADRQHAGEGQRLRQRAAQGAQFNQPQPSPAADIQRQAQRVVTFGEVAHRFSNTFSA